MHLLNIKRLAYETRSVADLQSSEMTTAEAPSAEKPGIDPATLAQRIDLFLSTRGVRKKEETSPPPISEEKPAELKVTPVEFVCEDDVREAIEGAQSIAISEKTIVTPAARDLAELHHVFTYTGLSTRH